MGMIYRVIPWIEEDEDLISDFALYSEAREYGNTYCPEGYDIEEIDEEDYYED